MIRTEPSKGPWVSLAVLARGAGIPEQTFRGRMFALNIMLDGKLMRRLSVTGRRGKWLVNRELYDAQSQPPPAREPKSFDAQLAEQSARLDALERRLQAVRDGQIRLRGRVARVEDALRERR
ncbi:MAG: hypothetical protein ACOY0T_09495 [Myxococcota bacterium]